MAIDDPDAATQTNSSLKPNATGLESLMVASTRRSDFTRRQYALTTKAVMSTPMNAEKCEAANTSATSEKSHCLAS